jgi:hypothetical protein
MATRTPSILLALAGLCPATPALAGGSGFWSRYNLGVSYDATTSHAALSYSAPQETPQPDDCDPDPEAKGRMQCTAYLAPDADETPVPSVFIEAPFERQGLFYFDYGLTFSTVTYKGGLVAKPASGPGGRIRDKRDAKTPPSQPLDHAYLELYGINWHTFVAVGITPRYLPDLIVSGGLGVQTVGGRVKMFKTDETRFVAQPEVFAEADLVLVRAYTGALSLYVSQEQSLRGGTRVIDDHPSGTALTDLSVELVTGASGIRLLFPF